MLLGFVETTKQKSRKKMKKITLILLLIVGQPMTQDKNKELNKIK